jgi:hypothetical protein
MVFFVPDLCMILRCRDEEDCRNSFVRSHPTETFLQGFKSLTCRSELMV